MEKLLIFIPAYNCEKQVPRVLSQLLDPHVLPWVGECIVVNNRSTDGTEAAVQDWMTRHPAAPVRRKPDENSAVAWFGLEEAVAASSEPWFRDRIYRKLNAKLALFSGEPGG